MKAAIFTDTFYPDMNGVAQTLFRLIHYFEKHNITYRIFAPESHLNEQELNQLHRYKSLPFFLYPECRIALPSLRSIHSELQQFDPDVIHVATPFTMGLCGVYFSKKLNIPLVGSYHTNFDHYLTFYRLQFLSKVLWKYMKWFHRSCKKLFVPSIDTHMLLQQAGFKNLEIWPRGVDCQLFHPFYDKTDIRTKYGIGNKYLLTYVGRLAPEKDLNTLLASALSMPPEMNDKIHWLIVGDGPMREELVQQAPANMTFTGYLKGKPLAEIYSASDLFVFPSPTETFGNVVLESLASGTPVIGAASGGVKTIVQSGETGILCSPGRAEEFTNAILQLLENHSLRAQMGAAARNYALTQNWDSIFANLLNQYTNLLKERNTSAH